MIFDDFMFVFSEAELLEGVSLPEIVFDVWLATAPEGIKASCLCSAFLVVLLEFLDVSVIFSNVLLAVFKIESEGVLILGSWDSSISNVI